MPEGPDLELALRLLSLASGLAVLFFFSWAAWVSAREGERQASVRLGFAAVLPATFFLVAALLPGSLPALAGGAVAALLVLVGGALVIPYPGRALLTWGKPAPGVDERDIMFSRAALAPGTPRYHDYYHRRPEHRESDEAFRKEPGLLHSGAALFHGPGFAAADAAFWTIEMLRPFVEGKAGCSGGDPPRSFPPDAASRFLKSWALKMGAHSAGVAKLRDYHLYTHVGRGEEYGEPVSLDHTFALALTVEMDKEMVDRGPRAPTVMESAWEYLRSGVMAIQLADMIRRMGYGARAHVDGNYRVICPLVARDAGLGEMGRMGLLMTPRLGPRVRIAVVTTDLPLTPDGAAPDPTMVDFCLRCRKCADACPSRALSFHGPRRDERGVLRWRIDAEACFTLWTRLGTDCARCMAVCPYSHADNALHSLVRWGVGNNAAFRRGAVWLDDLVYGRQPAPKGELSWMDMAEPFPTGVPDV